MEDSISAEKAEECGSSFKVVQSSSVSLSDDESFIFVLVQVDD